MSPQTNKDPKMCELIAEWVKINLSVVLHNSTKEQLASSYESLIVIGGQGDLGFKKAINDALCAALGGASKITDEGNMIAGGFVVTVKSSGVAPGKDGFFLVPNTNTIDGEPLEKKGWPSIKTKGPIPMTWSWPPDPTLGASTNDKLKDPLAENSTLHDHATKEPLLANQILPQFKTEEGQRLLSEVRAAQANWKF